MPTNELITALGQAVAAVWGKLPAEVQQALFEAAIGSAGEGSREKLAIYLHDRIPERRLATSRGERCPSPIALAGNSATVRDVTVAMCSIDDTLSDLLYDQERMLQHEIEDLSPV